MADVVWSCQDDPVLRYEDEDWWYEACDAFDEGCEECHTDKPSGQHAGESPIPQCAQCGHALTEDRACGPRWLVSLPVGAEVPMSKEERAAFGEWMLATSVEDASAARYLLADLLAPGGGGGHR